MSRHIRDIGWGYVGTINIHIVLYFHASTSHGV